MQSAGRIRRLAATLTVLCAVFAPARAQSVSAGLRGLVRDEGGHGIAGATVLAVDASTGVERRVKTEKDGSYQILLLRPGQYDVSVEADGYATGRSGIELPLNTTRTLDFTMQMAIEEHIEVSGTPPAYDPSNTSIDTRIDQQTIQSLPLNGRQFTDLALLDSSVQQAQPGVFFGERSSILTMNGSGARSNAYLVDGSDNNDFVFGTRGNGAFSAEVIQEFRLVRDGYSAEFGRASGGVMNIITRSGTNDFSGDAFFLLTNHNLNSTNAIVQQAPSQEDLSMDRQQFGFTVSGPFVQDKAFYFAAYEGGRGDDYLGYTGVTRDGVAGGAFPASTNGDQFFLRTDFNLSPVNYLSARLSYSQESVEGVNVIGRMTPEAGSSIDETDFQAAFSLRTVTSPHLFNEARLLWSDGNSAQQANSSAAGVERPRGTYGGNDLNSREIDERQVQFIDNLTFVQQSHTIKFGVDVSYVQSDVATQFNPNGVFSYGNPQPYEAGDNHLGTKFDDGIGVPGVDDDGDGIIDEVRVLDTYPEVYRLITGSPTASFDDTVIGLFIQDEWRPTQSWNLNFGLRYDLETFQLGDEYSVDSFIPNGGAKRDMNNLAPRFSFTWKPTEKQNFVLRGGVGVFYDKIVLGFPAVTAITSGQTIRLGFFQGLGFPCNEDLPQVYEEQTGQPIDLVDALFQVCGLGDTNTEALQLRFSTGDTLDTPYTVQWNLGFERTLGKHLLFGMNYVHARGYHVPLYRDLNPIIGGDPFVTGLPLHLDPTLGSVAAIETMGNTWYDGLQVRLQDGAGKFTYLLSYTFSKAFDESPDPLKGGVYLPPNPYDIRGERARSDNDQRHRFVFSATWDSPLWKLRFSPVVSYASGAPFNVTYGVDDNSRTLGSRSSTRSPATV